MLAFWFAGFLALSPSDAQLIRRETIEPGAGWIICIDAEASDTYKCPGATPKITAYSNNDPVLFTPNTNNIAGATLEISGLSPITIVAHDGSTLANNAIVAGRRYILIYNGTNFLLYAVGTGAGGGIGGTLVDDCIPKANGTAAIECSIIVDVGAGVVRFGTDTANKGRFVFPGSYAAPRDWNLPDEGGTVAFQKIKASWDADSIIQDGTLCTDPVTGQINSGPRTRWFLCADNNSSIFEGKLVNLPYAITTAIFKLVVNHGTTETITFAGDFSAACRAAGTTVNSTWGTAVAADVSITTAHQMAGATTSAVTPNGTCSAGSTLFWRYVIDATNFSASAANTRILGVYMAGE